MFDCDLHTHSRWFHTDPSVATSYDPVGSRLTLAVARQRGLEGIAITNHDYYRPTVSNDRYLPGIEISTTAGHLLVVGPDPPTRTEPGRLTPTEAVELAHEHDCAAIIAHPFRNSKLREYDAAFDAVELNGKHPEYSKEVLALAEARELPVVGGSDAHFPFEVGRVATRFEIDQLTPEAVVTAIQNGNVKPVIRSGPLLNGLQQLYTGIHRLKGHEKPPAVETEQSTEEHS